MGFEILASRKMLVRFILYLIDIFLSHFRGYLRKLFISPYFLPIFTLGVRNLFVGGIFDYFCVGVMFCRRHI